jgi:hypothetical protein
MIDQLEHDILDSYSIIQAHKNNNNNTIQHPSLQELLTFTTPDDIINYLEDLGFLTQNDHNDKHMDKKKNLRILGMWELDGPTPTEENIENRRRFAANLITHINTQLQSPSLNNTLEYINDAAAQATEELPTIHKMRKAIKGTTKQTPHWQELLPETIHTLYNNHTPVTQLPVKIATQLSNITTKLHNKYYIENQQFQSIQMANIEESRELYTKLNSPPNVICNTLKNITSPFLTWAPPSQDQCLKILTAYRDVKLKGQGPELLILIVPLDPIPDCNDANKIIDIWTHPYLHPKHNDIISNIHFSTPAHRIIQSGTQSPQHVYKNLAIFTLQPNDNQSIPLLIPWTSNNYTVSYNTTIWIDAPASNRWHIFHLLPALLLPGVASIDRPRPSRGSTPKEERTSIKIHFNDGIGSTLQKGGVIGYMRQQLQLFGCTIGLQDILCDNTTKLLDIPNPSALDKIQHLIRGAIIVGPRTAVVDTGSTTEQWSTALTQAWSTDPNNTPTKIRYRPSHPNKHKTYACIAATPEQLLKAKARGQHDEVTVSKNNPETLRLDIYMNVQTTGNVAEWMPELMADISNKSGIILTPQQDPEGLTWHSWKPMFDYEGAWTGHITIQLTCKEEVKTISQTIKNTSLEIQGHISQITSTSLFIDT